MQPRIEILTEKKLVGKRMKMSFSVRRTGELWRQFTPLRKEIGNSIGSDLYSIEVYDAHFFDNFNPETEFEKWAAIEVASFNSVPKDLETITLQRGLYAVFPHKGTAADGAATFRYIFTVWLPNSDYLPDNRPHFALMGEKYKNDDPNSEEELWIPVKSNL